MPRFGVGPAPAKIMLVGEAYGQEEERAQEPFVGISGQELNRMLHAAGIMRSECYATNLVNARPKNNDFAEWLPERKTDVTFRHVQLRDRKVDPIVLQGYQRLQKEIELVQPNVIVTFGNTPTWALTGAWGVTKWRGSMLGGGTSPKIIPTYHPAAVLRQWAWRAITIQDLKRVRKESESRIYLTKPDWHFQIRPSFSRVLDVLQTLHHWLESPESESGWWDRWIDFDLETRAGHIACAGLSWSRTDALVIPLMCTESNDGYWLPEEEAQIVWWLYRVLTHHQVKVRWQNGLYDAQYTWRHWHFVPQGGQDTMISQHSLFGSQEKSLAFQASMYCDHYVYWKDDGKTWHETVGEDQLWAYNAQDCIRTREVGEVEHSIAGKLGLEHVDAFQQRLFWPVLRAMQIGLRVVESHRQELINEIQEAVFERENFLTRVIGHGLNLNSPKQMKTFFYEDLAQPAIWTRPTKKQPARITCDDEALTKIGQREPLLRPITHAIADIRTLEKFMGFAMAKTGPDGRMRCSFNIGGSESGESAPYTYRLSSSKDAFGSGANLQTIPSEKSKSVGKFLERRKTEIKLADFGASDSLPNLRRMFGPDPGYTFFDQDLDRADLQVVVWEADDQMLKAALRMGADIHLLNAFAIEGKEPPSLEELVETHPKYPDHRGPRKHAREFAKVFCHATNYGGSSRTIAGHTGRTVHEIDRAQAKWFGEHPGIKRWHERTWEQVQKYHFVENRFGYRWYIFDRIDGILPEALAWTPQSTVSCVINRAWVNIHNTLPEVQVLLQVHDSLAGQFPTHLRSILIPKIKEASSIVIPYEDPLIIPVGLKTSEVSWGDCA